MVRKDKKNTICERCGHECSIHVIKTIELSQTQLKLRKIGVESRQILIFIKCSTPQRLHTHLERKNKCRPINISTVLKITSDKTSDTSSEYDTADDGSPGPSTHTQEEIKFFKAIGLIEDSQNVNPGSSTQIPEPEILPNLESEYGEMEFLRNLGYLDYIQEVTEEFWPELDGNLLADKAKVKN
ncbi:hypothetical protein Glove_109g118 [Diversispora epigaea]|uniref:Uncharacterized protein n=1 Tax=Diversispora epigaea TaxID=1348612 RepID=A0A397J5W4_9GLOM|nr:hypothetical protein Glove_109g118 [Diversispora epigaea]